MTITAGTAHNSNTGIVSPPFYLSLRSGRHRRSDILLFGADLRGLDGGFRFRLRLVDAVTHDRRGGGRRLDSSVNIISE